MARLLRVEYEGAVYHVTARGNERRRIYRDDEDRQMFLTTLEEAIREHGLRVHSFCLMPNHYHFLVETPRGNLSRGIGWLQTTYTIRFNRRHRRSGHLFQGRFKAHLVEVDSYAMELLRYIHLNPVRPRDKTAPVPSERGKVLQEYPWSSHRYYEGYEKPPGWLNTAWLKFFGCDEKSARKEYRRFMREAFGRVIQSPWEDLYRDIVLGGEETKNRVRDLLAKKRNTEKIGWSQEEDEEKGKRTNASKLSEGQNKPWKVWLRVNYAGEPRIDVARSLGYKDGSAVTQILKRLKARIAEDASIEAYAEALIERLENMSSVKR